jgi:hypothetical protein
MAFNRERKAHREDLKHLNELEQPWPDLFKERAEKFDLNHLKKSGLKVMGQLGIS